MDPDETLRIIRERVTEWYSGDGNSVEIAADLVEHLAVLDEWLSKGGFKPQAWNTTNLG